MSEVKRYVLGLEGLVPEDENTAPTATRWAVLPYANYAALSARVRELEGVGRRVLEMPYGSMGYFDALHALTAALHPKPAASAGCGAPGCVGGMVEAPAEGSRVLGSEPCPACNGTGRM